MQDKLKQAILNSKKRKVNQCLYKYDVDKLVKVNLLEEKVNGIIIKDLLAELKELEKVNRCVDNLLTNLGYDITKLNVNNKLVLLNSIKIQKKKELENENKKRRFY